MHIVSYRGPGQAGGVSAALARAWDCNLGSGGLWWHVDGSQLNISENTGAPASAIANLSEEVIKGHYRFCNDFLWPVMHDLPQHARYVPEDRALYETFNQTYGWCIIRGHAEALPSNYFVQDYQLALLPAFLKDNAGFRALLFWHIPWPQNVPAEYVPVVASIVRGMLGAEAIGFHTQEYANNFLNFVKEKMPEYRIDRDSLCIWPDYERVRRVANARWSPAERFRPNRPQPIQSTSLTRLLVAPLGIDFDHWTALAARQQSSLWHPALARMPFVLSVDRADYTKGVTDRIRAIDLLLERHPEWVGNIVFAQVCGKTRPGLDAFDGYWHECQRLYNALQERWSYGSWQPLVWLEKSFSSAELSVAYRSADVMLVNAVRDGLNLTAKEFVACQSNASPGVLALSSGTGAWQELGKHAVTLEPGNSFQIAENIHQALAMDEHERKWRMTMLKDCVKANTLSRWWYTFASLMNRPTVEIGRYAFLKESS